MNLLHRHLRYELHLIRSSRALLGLALGALLVAFAMAVVIGLTADRYLELDPRDHWALVATQGGTFTWPPYFAFVIALLGVVMWADDVSGEAAFVTYLSFGSRWSTAAVRSFVLTAIAAGVGLATWGVSIGTHLLLFDPPSIDGLFGLLMIKAVWTVVCAVTFGHLGAALCVVLRSVKGALTSLLLLPWLVEPIVVQILELAPSLRNFAGAAAYLPFRAVSATLGDRPPSDLLVPVTELAPSVAALYAGCAIVAAVATVQWCYCTNDGRVEH